jgi:hypothetical protein
MVDWRFATGMSPIFPQEGLVKQPNCFEVMQWSKRQHPFAIALVKVCRDTRKAVSLMTNEGTTFLIGASAAPISVYDESLCKSLCNIALFQVHFCHALCSPLR